jgi:predicted permease
MQVFWQDLRYGLRTLLKTPGFTTVAALTLALGIGANTAVFSFVNALLLRPLEGAHDPAALAQVLQIRDDRVNDSVSYLDWLDYRGQNTSFTGMAMYDGVALNLSAGQEAERIEGAMVTGDYFETLGVKAALGRLIAPDDTRAEGASPVVALSHGLWRNRFGGDPLIVGKTISLNGFGYTVIGVAAEGFSGTEMGERTDLWVPFTMWRQVEPRMAGESAFWKNDWLGDRGSAWMKAFVRLKPGVTVEQAQADLSTIAGRLARDYPQTNQKVSVMVAPGLGLPEQARGRIGQFLKLPMIIAGVVLLIVCANVAGMILARGETRSSEIGVRLALGARPSRIVRQLLTESIMLALAGGLLGLLLGLWLSNWLRSLLPETYLGLPLRFDLALDKRVFTFTLAISVLTGALSGIAPALRFSRLDLIPVLKGLPGRRSGAGQIKLREVLVVAQVALSFALLVAAALCVRTLQNARAITTGFDVEHALTARIDPGRQNYSEAQGREFYRRLIERMETMPGVEAAGLAPYVPLEGPQPVTRIHPEGRPPETGRLQVGFNFITPRYLEAVGVRLLKGRRFSAQDDQRSPLVAIINEALARRYWPDEDPLGRRFRFGSGDPDKPLIEIVGVVSDTKAANLFAPSRMYVYLPMEQYYQSQAVLHLRTGGQPERLVPAMRREIAALDHSLPVYGIKTLTRYRDDALTSQRMAAYLISGFGVLAMALAAIGLYGRMSFDVERRAREIGIRMALGAQPRDTVRLIVRQGMTLALIGMAAGLVVAFATTRLIKGLLFGVSATDPLTLVTVAALLTAAAGLACYIPTRRATKADPIKSLRYE